MNRLLRAEPKKYSQIIGGEKKLIANSIMDINEYFEKESDTSNSKYN